MSTPDYANYGGKRPETPDGWEEVGYRVPKKGEIFIGWGGNELVAWTNHDHTEPRVIVRRKPDIDPALVPPAGYQFRLDEYGRPVCRAPRLDEWYLAWDGAQAWKSVTDRLAWAECHYILDPIPSPPKMTMAQAIVEALKRGQCYVRSRSDTTLWPICMLPRESDLDDWEAVG